MPRATTAATIRGWRCPLLAIEAIGHDQRDTFFRQCGRLLKPDGQMLLQSITIADQRYQRARDTVDFIKRYVFPTSCIPSITVLNQARTRR